LGIVIPVNWLEQSLLLGKVIIDPLVTSTNTLAQAAITGSRYDPICNFSLSCDYTLIVNTPPAAVFTNVLINFDYLAQGACWMEDGANRFTLGGCTSPSAFGNYWFCNAPGGSAPGTCTGDNISIWSDVASCMPTPSCIAQPLSFGLKFYRSCFGTTGAACSGTCIGAASPWDVIIQGQTVNFTSPSPNQFNVSATSVCVGQNITATSLGTQYGVGPYNLNWSLSPTGLPSLGVGSPLSINFPTAGAYTLYCIVTDACGSTSTASKAITITPPPSAPTVTSPVTYCQNASASILTATGTSLEWFTVPVGGSPTGAPTPATGAPGTTSYYVQQTVGGCVSPRAQIDVVVNPFPTFGGGASATPASCGASDGSITGLTASGTGTITYVWSNTVPAVVSTTTTNANLSNQPAGNYNLTVTDANGCSNTYGPVVITSAAPPSGPTVTTPISYCLGATALALTATGSNLLWYTVPVGGVGSAVAPTPSTAIVGSTMYYVSQTISGCESARIQIEVIINNAPAAPTVTSPVNFCQGAVANALTATGTSLLWYTVPSGGVGSATAPTPSTAATGSVIYYVSQTSGGCESPRAQITVQVNAPPVINGTASVTPSSCGLSDGAITGLSATGVVTLTYTWTNAVAAVVSSSTTNATLSNQPAGTYTLTVTDAVGCSTVGTPVQITNNAAPAAPVATSPINYCQGAVASQLSATGTSLLWYTIAVGGTGSATAPTPSTTVAGTVSYYVSQTVAGCESPYTQIDVIVNPTPAAPTVTTPVNYCSGASPTALTATGSGLLWYTVAVGGTGSATAPTPSTLTAGSTSYYVTQTVSGCEGPNSQIVVQVNAVPVISGVPLVTPSNCGASDGAITGLSATGALTLTYTWTNAVVAVVSSSTTNATLSNQPSGTYTLTVTDAVGCSTVGTPLQITNNAAPAAPVATSPINYCQGAVASQLSATGTSLLWYTIAVGGTGSAIAPTPSTALAGTVSYYVSQTVAGCESPYTQIDIIVNPSPAAPTVTTPVNYCSGATPTALTATGSGLLWYTVAVGGIGSATAPTPSTLAAGSTSYYVTQTVSGCESPNAQIVVQVTAAPVISGVPVVTPSNCGASDGSIIGYTVSGTGTLTYTWTDASSIVIGTSTTSSDLSNQSAGTYTLTVSDAAGCTAVAAAQQITNISAPSAPVVTTPVFYCIGVSTNPLTATGTNLLWYTVPVGGVSSATAPTPSSAVAGTVSYYVSQTVAGCESALAQIDVTVTPPPTAPLVVSPVNLCQNAIAPALTAPGASLLWYSVPVGGTGSSTAPIPSTSAIGTTSYYVSEVNNGCESARAQIDVIINPAPAAPIVVTPISYCQGAVASALTATGASLLWYTDSTGGSGTSTLVPQTVTAGDTSYFVSQTIGGCESPRAGILVIINPSVVPDVTITSTNTNVCQGTLISFSAIVNNAGTNPGTQWLLNGNPIPGETSLNYSSSALTSNYSVSFQVNSTAICANPTQVTSNVISLNIMQNAIPSVSIVAEPEIVCEGKPVTITATAQFGGSSPRFIFRLNGVTVQDSIINTYTSSVLQNGDVVSVILSSNYQCISGSNTVSSNVITIEIASPPIVQATSAQDTIINGQSTLLTGTIIPSTTNALYMWEPATYLVCEVCESTSATPTVSTTYLLTVSDVNTGCVGYDTVNVIVTNEFNIFVPTAFSPNLDGTNDDLFVHGTGIKTFTLDVFDRWGMKIFTTSDQKVGWNGTHKDKPVVAGVYTYYLQFEKFDGSLGELKGNITLIR
jgi:gliding motility-associated-like protein